jgi:16S rRNA (guanine966-N2)-methyltransferase
MSEKMRGAIFNTLGDISGLSVLDAFAGSGAVGMEALSRGAATVAAIEQDRKAQATIRENLRIFSMEDQPYRLIRSSVTQWLEHTEGAPFDIIIADPPYDATQTQLIERLGDCLRQGGVYVLSWPGDKIVPELESAGIIKEKNYGDSRLIYYRKD